MPLKPKQGNKNSGKRKRKQISPLCTASMDDSENPHAHESKHSEHKDLSRSNTGTENGHTNGHTKKKSTENSAVNKRLKFKTHSPVYHPSNNMNFTPQVYPGQFSTPVGQYTLSLLMQATPGTEPPSWVLSLMQDVKNIKSTVAKIENVEKTVNSFNPKLKDLEPKVTSIDKRVEEV